MDLPIADSVTIAVQICIELWGTEAGVQRDSDGNIGDVLLAMDSRVLKRSTRYCQIGLEHVVRKLDHSE